MYANIFTKSFTDKAIPMLVGGLGVAVMLLFSMAVYREVDTSFYYELPTAMLDAVGISEQVGGIGGIAYGAIYNLIGAMTIAGLALSFGASTIAGEERDGTLGVLLGNPRSRSHVLAAKIAALLALVVFASLLLWGAAVAVPAILDVDVAGLDLLALVVHLAANAVLYGMLAVAIGAWTGNRTAASGGAAALLVVSWLATSFLPFIDNGDDIVKALPWYYFNGTQPEVNGISAGHLAVLLGASVVCTVIAFVGVNRRDLREASTAVTLLDRLRANPYTRRIADRIAGSARVSSIPAKTFSDHQGLVTVVAVLLCYMGLLIPPMYNLLPESFTDIMGELPDAMIAAIGGVNMGTPTGWVQGETFSLVVPIAFITVLAVVGSRALAGEEADRTMELLLANPISRTRVLLDKVVAMLGYALILGVITWATNAIGITLAGLDVDLRNLAGITLLGTLLGLVYGGVALNLSAATGRTTIAVYGAAGLGVISYFIESFFPLAEPFEPWAALSPFHYYLGSDPLTNGIAWDDAAILLTVFAVLVAAALPLFNRRDLRG